MRHCKRLFTERSIMTFFAQSESMITALENGMPGGVPLCSLVHFIFLHFCKVHLASCGFEPPE